MDVSYTVSFSSWKTSKGSSLLMLQSACECGDFFLYRACLFCEVLNNESVNCGNAQIVHNQSFRGDFDFLFTHCVCVTRSQLQH